MRIAIDASRTTVARITGTEQYSLRLIQSVIARNAAHNAAQAQPHDLTLYFRDRPPLGLFPANVPQRVIGVPRLWTHLGFAAALFRDRPDLTWVTAHALPFVFPGRAIVTVHDLGYRHFPAAHPPGQRAYLDLTTRTSANRATLVIADSAATRDDLTRFYATPPDKIRVIYPGVDAPAIAPVDVRRKYHLPDQYFLFLGTLQPRKNIAGLVTGYRRFCQQHPDDGIGLVLAGGQGWLYDPAWVTEPDGSPTPGVILPGYVDDADKGALYAGARAFVLPSLYEGFGFPVLEAMHCGTPVLCSGTSSLPELAGDAARLIDPTAPDAADALADGLARLAFDEAYRADLIERGRQQVKAFTWDRAADQVLAAFAEVS